VRCIDGVVADPLSAHAAKNIDRPPQNQGFCRVVRKRFMGILVVIMLVTLGLALRAGAMGRRASLAGSESGDEVGLIDTYARTSLLVLLCLIGLLSLGLMYGNVLGGGRGF